MRKNMVLVLSVLLFFTAMGRAFADIFTAADGGWSIAVDTARHGDGPGTMPTEGLVNWNDPFGYDYVYEDSWWGRGGADTSEGPLSSLTFFAGSKPAPNQILLSFKDNASLFVDLSYELNGSGLSSTILEKGILTNKGTDPLTLSIFKYADYDLTYGYSAHDDDYASGSAAGIIQHDAFSSMSMIPVSPVPDAFQISLPYGPGSIINSLNDSNATNLNNMVNPFGPADATFAFQWNLTLNPDQPYTLENMKTLTTTPEPVSTALFLSGGTMLAFRRICGRKKLS